MIRVLVVDDSGFMRIALRQIIEADGDLKVVGEARNGQEALTLAAQLNPDVITLDIEMPELDGIAVLTQLSGYAGRVPPVIMVSSHTQDGAAATIRALAAGAVDFVSKATAISPTDLGALDRELRPKLREWAAQGRKPQAEPARPVESACPPAAPSSRATPPLPTPAQARRPGGPVDLVVIGVSTGGPNALPVLLKACGILPCPIVVAQHMPDYFTESFAKHLAWETKLSVQVGTHHGVLPPGTVTLLPGGRDGVVARAGDGFELRLVKGGGSFHPCADDLFRSAALSALQPVAVIMTGMGNDGTDGARHLAKRGAPVLVQLPASCVVPGMPNAAITAGAASEALALEDIAGRLSRWTKSGNVQMPMLKSVSE